MERAKGKHINPPITVVKWFLRLTERCLCESQLNVHIFV